MVGGDVRVKTALGSHKQHVQVNKTDSIFVHGKEWGISPIVDESHKVVFFTQAKIGATAFHKLLRRMKGLGDWNSHYCPFNPLVNSLTYLYDFNISYATHIMNAPDWTRAIFVRDPKERFLSAYLDKAVGWGDHYLVKKCCKDGSCVQPAQASLRGFLNLTSWCHDIHWQPQSDRMPAKYLTTLDFVGHLETAAEDAKTLLERVGAWEAFGAMGWGKDGTESMFQTVDAANHGTSANRKMTKYYTPEIELLVEERYEVDYATPQFGFTIKKINYHES